MTTSIEDKKRAEFEALIEAKKAEFNAMIEALTNENTAKAGLAKSEKSASETLAEAWYNLHHAEDKELAKAVLEYLDAQVKENGTVNNTAVRAVKSRVGFVIKAEATGWKRPLDKAFSTQATKAKEALKEAEQAKAAAETKQALESYAIKRATDYYNDRDEPLPDMDALLKKGLELQERDNVRKVQAMTLEKVKEGISSLSESNFKALQGWIAQVQAAQKAAEQAPQKAKKHG